MQILNAPTRAEIDAAHAKGKWLEIGVSSARNALRVSKFKTCCWLGLLVSSIPIHLLFNSTVFETEHRESNFHLTIATEEFLDGGQFFPPGASLLTAEASDYLQYEIKYSYFYTYGYGTTASVRDYTDKESAIMKHLSSVASRGRTWDRIDVSDCLNKYVFRCNGLDRHRDLILVVDKPGGWTRNQMWQLFELGYDALAYNYLFWDRLVPANASNHLFYDTACVMEPLPSSTCQNDCLFALGTYDYVTHTSHFSNSSNSPYPFFGTRETTRKVLPILRPGSDILSVTYCLAEPLESNCYVGLSTTLLFAVTLSVVIKSGIALLVTFVLPRQNQNPLVTIGDSIASFIEKPDTRTAGFGSLGYNQNFINVGPKRWLALNKRRWAVVPISIWITSYFLFAIAISICLGFLIHLIQDGTLRNSSGGFFAAHSYF